MLYVAIASLTAQLAMSCFVGKMDSKGQLSKRIVGGDIVPITDRPYQLELQEFDLLKKKWNFISGAVIYGEEIVLTAAHVIYPDSKSRFRFLSGSAERGKGTPHYIKHMVLHPNYTQEHIGLDKLKTLAPPMNNDLNVAQITPPFKFSDSVRPIELVEKEPSDGEEAIFSGWGETVVKVPVYPKFLRKISMKIVDRKKCNEEWSTIHKNIINENHICAAASDGKGPCYRDSAGPLTVKGKLAGIASFTADCGRMNIPIGFVNVYHYKKWIEETIAGFPT